MSIYLVFLAKYLAKKSPRFGALSIVHFWEKNSLCKILGVLCEGSSASFLQNQSFRRTLMQNPKHSAEFWGEGGARPVFRGPIFSPSNLGREPGISTLPAFPSKSKHKDGHAQTALDHQWARLVITRLPLQRRISG